MYLFENFQANEVVICSKCKVALWVPSLDGRVHATADEKMPCEGILQLSHRSLGEFHPIHRYVEGRYTAQFSDDAKPYAYSDYYERIMKAVENKKSKLKGSRCIIVTDRRRHVIIGRFSRGGVGDYAC
jgi:hypothetical protein